MEQAMEFVKLNWEWFLLAFYVAEKVVRATPTKYDDILFDIIIAPLTKRGKK